ncbi:hypothetical protein HPB48_010148 [Haemaphysalis longicornis]|uniref:Cation/H+ exchanger domain-containing protein n=1 Tax=Haemaphysalis longicornis TaxID=44386 RepID=A0A9J6FU45_HAELO|nr:hypothetical protein HPB48_010148 [Haemaphysalis longicornis]
MAIIIIPTCKLHRPKNTIIIINTGIRHEGYVQVQARSNVGAATASGPSSCGRPVAHLVKASRSELCSGCRPESGRSVYSMEAKRVSSNPTYENYSESGILLLLLVIIASSVMRMMKRLVNMPVVAITVLWGFVSGWLVSRYGNKEAFLPVTEGHVSELLRLYMPVLVFTVAFNVRYHLFWRCFWQCVLLGGLGLGACSRRSEGDF